MRAHVLMETFFEGIELNWKEKAIIESVLCAYADCHNGLNEERNLGFFSPHPVSGSMAVAIAGMCIQSYNEFNKEEMQVVVDHFGEDALYFFAREGSVCVYVRPINKDISLDNRNSLGCNHDKFSYDSHLQMFRIWWD